MSDVRIKSGDQTYFGFTTSNTLSTAAVAASNATYKESPWASYQAIVTGTGSVSATVLIQGSNEDATRDGVKSNWVLLGTITLTGTTVASDGLTTMAPWKYVRANVTAISASSVVEVISGT